MNHDLRAARILLMAGRALPADLVARLYGYGIDVERLETQHAK